MSTQSKLWNFLVENLWKCFQIYSRRPCFVAFLSKNGQKKSTILTDSCPTCFSTKLQNASKWFHNNYDLHLLYETQCFNFNILINIASYRKHSSTDGEKSQGFPLRQKTMKTTRLDRPNFYRQEVPHAVDGKACSNLKSYKASLCFAPSKHLASVSVEWLVEIRIGFCETTLRTNPARQGSDLQHRDSSETPDLPCRSISTRYAFLN